MENPIYILFADQPWMSISIPTLAELHEIIQREINLSPEQISI